MSNGVGTLDADMQQTFEGREEAKAAARRRARRELARRVAAAVDTVDAARGVCEVLREALGARFAGIALVAAEDLRPLAWSADSGAGQAGPWQPALGSAARLGLPATERDEPRIMQELPALDAIGRPALTGVVPPEAELRAVAVWPLDLAERDQGVLLLGWAEPVSGQAIDLELMALGADYLAVAHRHAGHRAAAEQERNQLQTVLDALPASVFVFDSAGQLICHNAEAARVADLPATASSADLVAAYAPWRFQAADGRPLTAADMPTRAALQGKTPRGIDVFSTGPTGERRVARVASAPLRAADGTLAGAVTLTTNVTEVADALVQSRRDQRREHVVTSIASAVAASLDPRLVAEAACRAVRAAFDAEMAVVRSAEADGLVLVAHDADDAKRERHAAWLGQKTLIRPADQHLLAGASAWHEPKLWEDAGKLPVGSYPYRPVATALGIRGVVHVPLWAGDRFQGVLGIGWLQPLSEVEVDLSVLQLAGQSVASAVANARLYAEVERQRALREVILESMAEGVIVVDRRGHVIYHNTASERLLPRPPLTDRPLSEQGGYLNARDMTGQPITPERSITVRALLGDAVIEQVQVRTEAGDATIEASAIPFHAADGTPDGAVIVLRDVTATEELDRLKDQFLATIAHDVRSPLSTIKGYAQGIARRATRAGDAALARMGQSIDAQVDAIDRLLSDLLDARRIDQGRLEIRRRRLDLVAFVRDAAEAIQLDPRFRDRAVQLELPETPIMGHFDAGLLRRVLENLLSNAVKYSAAETVIRLALTTSPGEARLTVRDAGIGIPPGALPHIFEQFYRAPNARERSRGQGLGLFVAKSMVEAHGGRIAVLSVEGEGTAFTVSLAAEP